MSSHAEIQSRRLVRPETDLVSISSGGTYEWDPRKSGTLNVVTTGTNYAPLEINFHPDYVPVRGETLRIEGREGVVGGFLSQGMIDLQSIVVSESGPRPRQNFGGTLVYGRVNSSPVSDQWFFYPDVEPPTAEDVVRSLHAYSVIADGISAVAQTFVGPTFPLPDQGEIVKCSIANDATLDLTYLQPLWSTRVTSDTWAYGSPSWVNNWMLSDGRTYYGCQAEGSTGTQLGGWTSASSTGSQFGAHASAESVWVVDTDTTDANEVGILLILPSGSVSINRSTDGGSNWTGIAGLSIGTETVTAVIPDVRIGGGRSGTFFVLTAEGSVWYFTGAGGIGSPSNHQVVGPTGSAFRCGVFDSFTGDAYFGGDDGQVYRAIGDDWTNTANYESTGNISSVYTVRAMAFAESRLQLYTLLGRDRGGSIGEEVFVARSDTRAIYWTTAPLHAYYDAAVVYPPHLDAFGGYLYLSIPLQANDQQPVQFYRMLAV